MEEKQIEVALHNESLFLFDLGGVIINLDWEKSFTLVCDLLDIKPDELIKMVHHDALFLDLEIGKISRTDFFTGLESKFEKALDHEVLFNAFNEMLLDIPKERIELIKDLKKKGKQAFYFSDTNLLLEAMVSKSRPNDIFLIMSNGGFDDIHRRLLERL